MKIFEQIFSIKNKGYFKFVTVLGLKFKLSNYKKLVEEIDKIEQMKKEIQNHQYVLDKRFEQFLRNFKWLEHTNRVLNKLIELSGDEELKKSQIKYLFSEIHKNEYDLNIDNPKTFNEKIHWMSLNYYNISDEVHRIVDKYQFKEYIREKLGEGYTVPLLGKWDSPYDIDYSVLPDKFVLKSNWGGDGNQVKIVKDKAHINIAELNEQLQKWLSFDGNMYYYAFNGPVKKMKPCIIAEEYMPIRENEALEYKMFCFNGKLAFCLVEIDYFGESPYRAYYDKNFEELNYKISKIPTKHLDYKPKMYDKMVEIAEFLSKEFPFVRVDFYDVSGLIYVGEMTFTSGGGFSKYDPIDLDYKFGEMLDITQLTEGKKNNA